MRIRVPITLLAGAALCTMLAATAARASDPCIREAKQDYKDCTADCKEGYQSDKDTCLDRDHACVEICRANRSQCRLDSGIDAALQLCNDRLEGARKNCRDNNPSGDSRDQCIDLAQVEAFQCRDAAREAAKPALKRCRRAFRACAKACSPAANPPPDPNQCLLDAKTAVVACLISEDDAAPGCREVFQTGKDDCRNRDHDCVEQCREERNTCNQPVRDQLSADLAVCESQRKFGADGQEDGQGGIDGCKAQYPKPRDDAAQLAFDQCVDPIQVEAFICRDNAHEAAHPGFEACRDQFRSCVETNCPKLS